MLVLVFAAAAVAAAGMCVTWVRRPAFEHTGLFHVVAGAAVVVAVCCRRCYWCKMYSARPILIRTCDHHKNLYIALFSLTIFSPDYNVPRKMVVLVAVFFYFPNGC